MGWVDVPDGRVSYDEIRERCSPRIRTILEVFDFEHLPDELKAISKPFCDLAHLHAAVGDNSPAVSYSGYEVMHLEHGLWRLLEAKDAIVRAALAQ